MLNKLRFSKLSKFTKFYLPPSVWKSNKAKKSPQK